MQILWNICSDWENKDEICEYLLKILDKQAFDHAGLIYGMGHAVYTLSDPRAVILKKFAKSLSEEKGMQKEFALYELVEREAGNLIMQKRQMFKPVCANVDFTAVLYIQCLEYLKSCLHLYLLFQEFQDGAHIVLRNL